MPEPLLEMDRSENPLREKLTTAFEVEDGQSGRADCAGLRRGCGHGCPGRVYGERLSDSAECDSGGG